MTDIMTALFAFWSRFGIPAYAEDMVPPTATLPYIRYTVGKADAMQAMPLVAFNYHDAKLMGNAERARMAGRIAEAIPPGGVKIKLENGFLILRRGSDFQTPYQDPDDKDIIGVRTSVEVYFYTI